MSSLPYSCLETRASSWRCSRTARWFYLDPTHSLRSCFRKVVPFLHTSSPTTLFIVLSHHITTTGQSLRIQRRDCPSRQRHNHVPFHEWTTIRLISDAYSATLILHHQPAMLGQDSNTIPSTNAGISAVSNGQHSGFQLKRLLNPDRLHLSLVNLLSRSLLQPWRSSAAQTPP